METPLQIPQILRQYSGGKAELILTGTTVRAMLTTLRSQHPQLYHCICDETDNIRRHVNLFVNEDFLHQRDGLDTRLQPGDIVSVFQAVSGG